MKSRSLVIAVFAFVAMACGGSQEELGGATEFASQQAALSGPIVGTWCQQGWPGCIVINTDGNGFMLNNGDSCWRAGDLVFSGLAEGAYPSTYAGTRLMYGSGYCGIRPPHQRDTLTVNGNLSFAEVTSGGFMASWYRATP